MQGVSGKDRAVLWPFLLGVFSPDSTFSERVAELQRLRNVYTKLVFVCEEFDMEIEAMKCGKNGGSGKRSRSNNLETARYRNDAGDDAQKTNGHSPICSPRSVPSSCESSPEKSNSKNNSRKEVLLTGNYASFAESHRIIVLDAVRTDMRGIVEKLADSTDQHPGSWETDHGVLERKYGAPSVTVLPVSVNEGLPELMLVDPPKPKPSQAVANGQAPIWRSSIASQNIDAARHLPSSTRHLMMRLVNILSAYAIHDPENGYCQGMSDLAAVFVCLEEEDALVFACFERFMRTVRQNFRHDESGIKHQLMIISQIIADTDPQLHKRLVSLGADDCMFAYRMVVVLLRRELPLGEVLTLWEITWALERKLELEECSSDAIRSVPSSRTISLLNAQEANSSKSNLQSTIESLNSILDHPDSEDAKQSIKANQPAQGSSWRGHKLKKTAKAPPDFILQFVAAVIKSKRDRILNECAESDDILRMFSGIDIDFWYILRQAKKQNKAYCQGITVMQSLYS